MDQQREKENRRVNQGVLKNKLLRAWRNKWEERVTKQLNEYMIEHVKKWMHKYVSQLNDYMNDGQMDGCDGWLNGLMYQWVNDE